MRRSLRGAICSSDPGAAFDRELHVDCTTLAPQVTGEPTPVRSSGSTASYRIRPPPNPIAPARSSAPSPTWASHGNAGRGAGRRSRVHRLVHQCARRGSEAAAAVARGRHVAARVRAIVVPGSMAVKREAEKRGLDRIFRSAGFEWHESGCSMCAGANGDLAAPGSRSVATSNRNFENRQGPGVRTHLVSPAMAAAAAIAGRIVDVTQPGALEGADDAAV